MNFMCVDFIHSVSIDRIESPSLAPHLLASLLHKHQAIFFISFNYYFYILSFVSLLLLLRFVASLWEKTTHSHNHSSACCCYSLVRCVVPVILYSSLPLYSLDIVVGSCNGISVLLLVLQLPVSLVNALLKAFYPHLLLVYSYNYNYVNRNSSCLNLFFNFESCLLKFCNTAKNLKHLSFIFVWLV